eukprot:SAG11_NODE_1378_length_5084_cov_3.339619_3_plen_82_part_00
MQTRPLMDERCVCVLRAMLGCFSEALYAPQAEVNSTANRWLAWATSPSNALAPALFSALVRSSCVQSSPFARGVAAHASRV